VTGTLYSEEPHRGTNVAFTRTGANRRTNKGKKNHRKKPKTSHPTHDFSGLEKATQFLKHSANLSDNGDTAALASVIHLAGCASQVQETLNRATSNTLMIASKKVETAENIDRVQEIWETPGNLCLYTFLKNQVLLNGTTIEEDTDCTNNITNDLATYKARSIKFMTAVARHKMGQSEKKPTPKRFCKTCLMEYMAPDAVAARKQAREEREAEEAEETDEDAADEDAEDSPSGADTE